MGFNLGLYHGVYMIVPFGIDSIDEQYFVHPGTGVEMKNQYDPNTGIKADIKTRPKVVEKFPTPHIIDQKNLQGFDIDTFFIAESDGFDRSKKNEKKKIFMLNNYCDFHFNFPDPSYGQAFHKELPQVDREVLIEQFKRVYKKYIDLFESEYGPITIHYGVVAYYS